MRIRLGALMVVTAMALAVAGTLGASAGAQTTTTTIPFTCSFSVDPTTLPEGGGVVTVSGTAPANTVVRIFVDGTLAATTTSAPVTGAFSASVPITASVEITVALDGYPSTPCTGVGGTSVQRGRIVVGGVTSRRLASTGASETRPTVLLGLGALSLGVVLVVAARRRRNVLGRD